MTDFVNKVMLALAEQLNSKYNQKFRVSKSDSEYRLLRPSITQFPLIAREGGSGVYLLEPGISFYRYCSTEEEMVSGVEDFLLFYGDKITPKYL